MKYYTSLDSKSGLETFIETMYIIYECPQKN